MGRRGPPPKPSKLKLVGKGPGATIRDREPQRRQDAAPRCPKWLSPLAKHAWTRMVPELRRLRLLTAVDRGALEAYSQTYARWREAEDFLQKHGSVYPLRDEQGRVKYMAQFPRVAIARTLLQTLRSYQHPITTSGEWLAPRAAARLH